MNKFDRHIWLVYDRSHENEFSSGSMFVDIFPAIGDTLFYLCGGKHVESNLHKTEAVCSSREKRGETFTLTS